MTTLSALPAHLLIGKVLGQGEIAVITGNRKASAKVRPIQSLLLAIMKGAHWLECPTKRGTKAAMLIPAGFKDSTIHRLVNLGYKPEHLRQVFAVPKGDWDSTLAFIKEHVADYGLVIVARGEEIWGWGWDSAIRGMEDIRTVTGAAVIGDSFDVEDERSLFGAPEPDVIIEIAGGNKNSISIRRSGERPIVSQA